MICNKDCEHCPYPDCINDEMDLEDYEASAERDKLLRVKSYVPKDPNKPSYYERNREACLVRCKAHCQKHPEHYRNYRKKYYQENKTRVLLRQKAYDKRIRDPEYRMKEHKGVVWVKIPAETNNGQRFYITYARLKRGMSGRALAEHMGINMSTLYAYERGIGVLPGMDAFITAMPEIESMIGKKCWEYCDRANICDREDCFYRHIRPNNGKRNPPADVEDRQAEGVSAHLPHDNK